METHKPIAFLSEFPGRLAKYSSKQITDHSRVIIKNIDNFQMYTGVKTLPASLISEHKNKVASFKRNF